MTLTADLPLSLVAAPTYTEVDEASSEARGAMRVMVRVGLAANPSSFLADIAWDSARLRAEISLVAFLDDISCSSELFLLRPFTRSLNAEGALIGLLFDTVPKNYAFVPRCFADVCRALFPDAAFVDDNTPGASPKAQLEFGARQLAAGSSGLLISHVGIAKLMGAPLRTLCPGEGLARDQAWLAA